MITYEVATRTDQFLTRLIAEVSVAMQNWPPMNSLHEGYSAILEEMDELWDHVRLKQTKRDQEKIYSELVQIAAMALRTAVEVVTKEGILK